MNDADQAALIAARERLPVLLTTVAPETVEPQRIEALARAGIVVSLGHSDASYRLATAAAQAGATMVTHLFNAMSQIGNREPGLAGAAIDTGSLSAGLIADGIHVDPATIGIALRAKRGPGKNLPRHRRDGDDRHRHDIVHAQRPHHPPQGRQPDGWPTARWPAPIST